MANQYIAYRFISDTHKECSLCGEIKLHSEFHRDKNKRNKNLAFYCKTCANRKTREYHNKHKGDVRYLLKRRNFYTKRNYGLTVEEYTKKLLAQEINVLFVE